MEEQARTIRLSAGKGIPQRVCEIALKQTSINLIKSGVRKQPKTAHSILIQFICWD